MPFTHKRKIELIYYTAILAGVKRYEIRENRATEPYKIGNLLELYVEFSTLPSLLVEITWLNPIAETCYGKDTYVLSITEPKLIPYKENQE